MEPLLTTQQAADLLGISPRFIMARVKDGSIPIIRISSTRVRFKPSDLEAFAASKTAPATKKQSAAE